MKNLLFVFSLTSFIFSVTLTSCGENTETTEETAIDGKCCENPDCTCKEEGKNCSKGESCSKCGKGKSCDHHGGKSCAHAKECKHGDSTSCKHGHHSEECMAHMKKHCTEDCTDKECSAECKAAWEKEGKSCPKHAHKCVKCCDDENCDCCKEGGSNCSAECKAKCEELCKEHKAKCSHHAADSTETEEAH